MGKPIGISPRTVTSLLGALFVVSWSSGFIGAKLGAADAPSTTVLMWRFLPLAALLVPVLLLPRVRRTAPGGWGRQIVVGALSQSGYLLAVYSAVGLGVSTGTTALIDGMQPLVVAALVGPLLGMAVSGRQWVGMGIGLLGVALVILADASAPATDAPVWAYAVPAAGMLSLVAATVLDRRATVRPAPMTALALHSTASAFVFTALALVTGTAVPPASTTFWVATVWLIVLPTFGGYGLYWFLLARTDVTVVNALLFLVPPVTTLWGALMFGEPFSAVTALGLTLALSATWIVTRAARGDSAGIGREDERAGERSSSRG